MYNYYPTGKYHHKRLPMGVSNSPENSQHKMNDLFQGFEFICEYMDKLLIPTKGDWTYHVQKLERTLNKLKEVDPNVILKVLSSEKPKWNI